jgi:ribonuclease Z
VTLAPALSKATAVIWLAAGCLALSMSGPACAQNERASRFTVTLLGTGSPNPSIERFGPSTLVEAGNQRLVFDCGRGATIRLFQLGIRPAEVTAVFLTHLHSDHVNGLADLWLTGWTFPAGARRLAPFEVYGPTGTAEMMTHLTAAHAADIRIRLEDEDLPAAGVAVNAHDVTEGVIYEHEGVRVTVFDVDHGELIKPAFGYRIDYQGHSVVLSGDTRSSENLIAHAKGADVLIHEVMAAPRELLAQSEAWRKIMNHHTSPEDAGRVFAESGVRLAVYSHIIVSGYDDEQTGLNELIRGARASYAGQLAIGEDLMSIEVGDALRLSRRSATATK